MSGVMGRVYLVGAGCGGAELLTLRGLCLLRRCEAVVYDDLIGRDLLDLPPENAERLYMGKRDGLPSASQEEICAALIRLAREGKTVVRLKGGDPFVFGRGAEEMEALRAAGVPCEEVPGISSAIAVPAAAGIPVTCRGLSQSVHIVTARTAGGGLSEDIDRLAGLEGTLVFLMGLGRLEELVQRLIEAGKDPKTPAAVVSGGNAPHPAAVRGPLARLPELAACVRSPAVIVVGATAALALESTAPRPLAGLRVGLTGTPGFMEKLTGPLREYGAQVFSALRLEVLPLPVELGGLFEDRPWLAFTSANGVRRFFQAMTEQALDIRVLAGCKLAAVGAATEAALWARGLRADLRPEPYTTAALGEALLRKTRAGEEILLFRSAQADSALREKLEAAGRAVRDFRIYDVCPRRNEHAAETDCLVFGSAGGARAYLEAYGIPPKGTACVCVGPVTAAVLAGQAQGPVLTAWESSAEGIIEVILNHAAL